MKTFTSVVGGRGLDTSSGFFTLVCAMHPTQRFTDRAEQYHANRPRYPADVLTLLRERCNLQSTSTIADLGSGTGILTELFLENGSTVHAVEPNESMRAIAERRLGHFPGFHSVGATAEATTLPDRSIDFAVAGQAFHWFDRIQVEREFARILRPGGWIVLIWNERLPDSSPFAAAYEEMLLNYSIDYKSVDPKQVSGDRYGLDAFFRQQGGFASFRHSTKHTFETFAGLVESASYAPLPGHSKYEAMMEQLRRIFHEHQRDETVTLDYLTKVYFGPRPNSPHQ